MVTCIKRGNLKPVKVKYPNGKEGIMFMSPKKQSIAKDIPDVYPLKTPPKGKIKFVYKGKE
jgi:hypothetical protein